MSDFDDAVPSDLDAALSSLFNYIANERIRAFNAGVDQGRARKNDLARRDETAIPLTPSLDLAIRRFTALLGRVPTGEEITELAAAQASKDQARHCSRRKPRRKHK